MSNGTFQFELASDGIGTLTFNLAGEKVNKFSIPVLEELEKQLDQIKDNQAIKVLLLKSGKDDVFIAGADLHSFEPAFVEPSIAKTIIRTGHRVFDKLSALPYPTVAVINGACLGGGLECALSCTYRIVTDHPKTLVGLPEVNLGIFPGWGGTQRLPRLIGLMEGMNMILAGKIVPGAKAYKARIADAIVPWQFRDAQANEFAHRILDSRERVKIEQKRTAKPLGQRLFEDNPLGRAIVFSKAKKSVLEKTKGNYPAPLIALDVIEKTYPLSLADGLKIEADTFIDNVPEGFKVAPYLIGLFFTQEALKKDTGVSVDVKPTEIRSAAVIGAGTMGAGIAWLLADHKVFTRLKDLNWDILGRGLATAKGLLDKGLKAKKMSASDHSRRLSLLSGTTDYSGFQNSQLIIEAATETLDLKKKIFQELEANVKDDAIIASNTSSLTIAEMSEGMKHPERFIGMHFFNPVNKMPLVEIVAGATSTPLAIVTAVDLCKKLGKMPMVVKDCPGFLVNRIFLPGATEAILMLEEGYSIEMLDDVLLKFGMPMKPLLLADEVGNDVAYKVGQTFEHAYGERMRPAKLLQLMVEKELYGKKNGKGFYLYKGDKATVNPQISKLLHQVRRTKEATALPKEDILPRFLYGMINEAARCLEENVVSRPDYLDLALIMGIGFPPFQGGLLHYADKVGIDNVVKTLQRFETELGPRFKPAPLLLQKAADGTRFYPLQDVQEKETAPVVTADRQ